MGGFLTIRRFHPEIDVALPNEDRSKATVHFYTPDDLPMGSFDAAINMTSFQELDPPIVADYFHAIDRWLITNGLFVCINRHEKIVPHMGLESRFDEYPWPKSYRILQDDEAICTRKSGFDTIIRRRVIKKVKTRARGDLGLRRK